MNANEKTFYAFLQPSLWIRARDFRAVLADDNHPQNDYCTGPRIYFVLRRPLPRIFNIREFQTISDRAHRLIGRGHPSEAVSFEYELSGARIPCTFPGSDLANYVLALDGDWAYLTRDDMPPVFIVSDETNYSSLLAHYPDCLGLKVSANHDESALSICVYGQGRTRLAEFDPVVLGTRNGLHPDVYGEVLYVGQTTDSVSRFKAHEKAQKALENRGRNEDVFILTCSFLDRCFRRDEHIPLVCELGETTDHLITPEDKLSIIERVFIHHFDPPLNERDKGPASLSTRSTVISRSLAAHGYTGIRIPFDPENPLHFIGSKKAGYHHEHLIEFSAVTER